MEMEKIPVKEVRYLMPKFFAPFPEKVHGLVDEGVIEYESGVGYRKWQFSHDMRDLAVQLASNLCTRVDVTDEALIVKIGGRYS